MLNLPFFAALEGARTILLAGAGGGFDIFCSLPLYFGLRHAGRQVHLASLSFSNLHGSSARELAPGMARVTADVWGVSGYFPELYLSKWFAERGESIPIYCFSRMGVQPLHASYQALVDALQVDAVVLIDGGTDSLMRGDEAGLGTPQEDVTSIAAVDLLNVPTKLLMCLGFGIDAYHGVCHAQFLEAVAALIQQEGFLGAWSLTADMPEATLYREAVEAVFRVMGQHTSIVQSSILSALEGRFGDYHVTSRTANSSLFINPLMSLYWCFWLDPVARRNLYLDEIRDTQTYWEVTRAIEAFRNRLREIKPWVKLPM